MIDLPLILLGGVLGSSHCVGMCGGFALAIGLGARSAVRNMGRQLTYCAGRVFTYAFLGAAAGFAGFWFARRSSALVHAQAILSLAAGMLLVAQGSTSLGLIPRAVATRLRPRRSRIPCLAASFVRSFFSSPRWPHVFLAGMLNGLLPCGLVYGYLALASSTANIHEGLATMAAFGAGTVPVMALTGVGASVLSLAARQRLIQVSAACVLLTGLLAIARGLMFWNAGAPSQCPGCSSDGDSTLGGMLAALWR